MIPESNRDYLLRAGESGSKARTSACASCSALRSLPGYVDDMVGGRNDVNPKTVTWLIYVKLMARDRRIYRHKNPEIRP